MIIEENTYLSDYYGMMRDIYAHPNRTEIIFSVILNIDVSFTFTRTGVADGRHEEILRRYIDQTPKLSAGLPYNAEAVGRINAAVKQFIQDVIDGKVLLPSSDYIYAGDKDYLKEMLVDDDCNFIWLD